MARKPRFSLPGVLQHVIQREKIKGEGDGGIKK